MQVRFTWQISPKNKLAVYNDRLLKNRGSAMTAGFDPKTAGIVWNSPIYTTGSVKFRSTISNRIFFEAGFSTNYERYNTLYQPGLAKSRSRRSGTPSSTRATAAAARSGTPARPTRACIPIASPP